MARSVVLFSIDGLRADALQEAETPYIDRLIEVGAHTYAARSVMPSVTLPCHMSMFRGVGPERHGITTNTWMPQVRPIPSIIDAVHAVGKTAVSFYNWEELRDLSDPGSLALSCYLRNCYEPEGDLELAEVAASHLGCRSFDFAFVYLGHTDVTGHDHGWMSAEYLAAEETACIVTSDHGGHAQTHGTDMDDDMTIPWVICGGGAPQGRKIERDVCIIDNPPTIAALLGLEVHRDWAGAVIDEVAS